MSTHRKARPTLHVNAGKIVAPAEPPDTAVRPAPGGAVIQRKARIAVAAYYLAERRNFARGYEIEDWLTAERDIDAKQSAFDDSAAVS